VVAAGDAQTSLWYCFFLHVVNAYDVMASGILFITLFPCFSNGQKVLTETVMSNFMNSGLGIAHCDLCNELGIGQL
jgi:hypothetical protein